MSIKKKYISPQIKRHDIKLQNNMCDLYSQIGIEDGKGNDQWTNMRDVDVDDEELIDINEGLDF